MKNMGMGTHTTYGQKSTDTTKMCGCGYTTMHRQVYLLKLCKKTMGGWTTVKYWVRVSKPVW